MTAVRSRRSGPWDSTALVLLDLMPRLLDLDLAPRSGARVLDVCVELAVQVREAGGHVLVVRTERPGLVQPPGSDLAGGISRLADQVVVKHTIGAFHETVLGDELTSRGVTRIVLGGVMTNLAVESTARAASDHGWDDLVFVEDAMSALSRAEHVASVRHSLPRFGRLVTADRVAALHATERG